MLFTSSGVSSTLSMAFAGKMGGWGGAAGGGPAELGVIAVSSWISPSASSATDSD
jgi:hypothetical protein